MKRALFAGAALGFILALVTSPGTAVASNPTGEFTLLLRLNGSPTYLGHTAPRADAGTIGRTDAGFGNIVKTQCSSPACVCPGTSCSCGDTWATLGTSNGEYLAANATSYIVLTPSNAMVTTAAANGATLLDGGPGTECNHWTL